jgi:hypothetical protein
VTKLNVDILVHKPKWEIDEHNDIPEDYYKIIEEEKKNESKKRVREQQLK